MTILVKELECLSNQELSNLNIDSTDIAQSITSKSATERAHIKHILYTQHTEIVDMIMDELIISVQRFTN